MCTICIYKILTCFWDESVEIWGRKEYKNEKKMKRKSWWGAGLTKLPHYYFSVVGYRTEYVIN
jgi:hypothetical protein